MDRTAGDDLRAGSPSTGGWHAILSSARYFLIFAIPVVVVGMAISFASDDKGYSRYRPGISDKLAVLKARPPVPNAIFVGASVTFRSIVPAEVDASAAQAGCEGVHAVNLGMPGTKVYEAAFMLDRVLEQPDLPPGSFIVFDVLSPQSFSFENIAKSERSPVAARLRYLPDVVASAPFSWEHLRLVVTYLRASLGEALGFNAISDIAMEPWRNDKKVDSKLVADRGYVPLEAQIDKERIAARRERFLTQSQDRHEHALTNWKLDDFKSRDIRVNPFAGRIAHAGFVPVAYAPPYKNSLLVAALQRAQLVDSRLKGIAITPDNAPAIYADTGMWFDRNHMSQAGAKIVSAIVGRALCALIKGD